MFMIDGEIGVLARAMITNYPKDAADRATLRLNAFFVLGFSEKSPVAQAIKNIRAG